MTHTPPVAWRTRRQSGTAETLHVATIDNDVRVSARGFRLRLSYAEAVMLAASIIDAIESVDRQSHVCAHTFAEQLDAALAAAPDSETRSHDSDSA